MKKEGKGTDIIITTIKKKRRRNKRKRHCMEITLPQVVVFSQKEKKEHFLSIKISVFFFVCFSYECSFFLMLLFTLIHLPTPPLSPPSLPPWNPPGKQIQMRSHAKKPKENQQPKTKQQKNIKRPKSKQKKKSKKAKSSKKVSRRRWRRRRRTRLWSGELGKDIRKNNDGGGGGGRWHFFFGGYFLFVCFCLKFCVFFDTTETC